MDTRRDAPDRRGSLENQALERLKGEHFFSFALNNGFFLCYFRRRVEFVSFYHRRSQSAAFAITSRRDHMAKKNAAPTKSEILTTVSKETELTKKQVGAVFDSLSAVIKKSLRSHGLFTLPGLLKMKVVRKPATKAREGVNPFNGEKMMFKAKPASKKVRIAALKTLKEFVN
jgi:DNA-binding protein HU-beta